MSKLGTRHMALVLGLAAVIAAGCGSSSKSSKSTPPPAAASTPTAPATPATPSTPSTTTTTSGAPGQVALTTPTNSPAFKALLVKDLEKNKLSPTKAEALAGCISEEFDKHGIKTVGDIDKEKSTSHQIAVGCGLGVGIAAQIYGIK